MEPWVRKTVNIWQALARVVEWTNRGICLSQHDLDMAWRCTATDTFLRHLDSEHMPATVQIDQVIKHTTGTIGFLPLLE